MKSLRITGKLFLYLLCALLMLLALALAGARVAVFYVHDYKEQIAGIASSYLGSPVQIDNVDLVWDRFDAMASLSGVRIKSENGARTLLVLPRLELLLNARDIILQRKLTVRRVTLHGLSIHASYEGSGNISVVGYRAGAGGSSTESSTRRNSNGPLAWLFNAGSIAILDSEILLSDRKRNREYKLDKLDIRAWNEGDQHQIRINSALPNALGDSSTAAFNFRGKADDIQQWQGEVYFKGAKLDLKELASIGKLEGVDMNGKADLQLWGSWSGTRLNSVRAVLDTKADVLVDDNPLSAQVALDTDWQRTSDGWGALFNQLLFQFPDASVDLSGLQLDSDKNSAAPI